MEDLWMHSVQACEQLLVRYHLVVSPQEFITPWRCLISLSFRSGLCSNAKLKSQSATIRYLINTLNSFPRVPVLASFMS